MEVTVTKSQVLLLYQCYCNGGKHRCSIKLDKGEINVCKVGRCGAVGMDYEISVIHP